MIYVTCKKCGRKIKIQRKATYEKHKNDEFECIICNSNQNGYVCKVCGEVVLFNNDKECICRSCKWKRIFLNEDLRIKLSKIHKKRFKEMTAEEKEALSHRVKEMWTDEWRQKWKEIQKQRWSNADNKEKASIKMRGNKNPMYGKSVYEAWVEKYGKEEADRRHEDWKSKIRNSYEGLSKEELKERYEKTKRNGKANGMYGRSVYSVWVEKYGKEEADRRNEEMKRKQSEKSKGKNNPMYGKSTPKGSGNGISGWYKGWYFRSLRELSYMVNVIEKEGHEWRSLDNTPDFRIKYLDKDGHERSYCPDFLIDNKIIVEIKPKQLQNIECNTRKKDAALIFCLSRNYEYKIVDVEINTNQIYDLYVSNAIELTERSKEKIKKFYEKHKIHLTFPNHGV